MATPKFGKPLKVKETIISFPYRNNEAQIDSPDRILVTVTQHGLPQEIISLRSAYPQYYPHLHRHLLKYNGTFKQNIVDYYDTFIESCIEYEYDIGIWGYITSDEPKERSFGKITALQSKYETEMFFLHEDLYKYEFSHFDITSDTVKESEDMPSGWIVESCFTPVSIPSGVYGCQITPTHILELLQWKFCREDFLQYQMEIQKQNLLKKVSDRGVLFRETFDQFQIPHSKALRGKISTKNIHKTVELKFHTPSNLFTYLLEPKIEDAFNVSEDESLNYENNKCIVQFEILELMCIIEWEYLIKLYDQNAQAFKINKSIALDPKDFDSFEDLCSELIKIIDKKALERYKMLKKNKVNKYLVKRKVKYFITINGMEYSYNTRSGQTLYAANVYKITKRNNGTFVTSGKVDIF